MRMYVYDLYCPKHRPGGPFPDAAEPGGAALAPDSRPTDGLFDHELVAAVLAIQPGKRLARITDSLFALLCGRALTAVTDQELRQSCGLEAGEARRLAAAVELGRRLLWPDDGRRAIRSPQDACRVAAAIRGESREHFLVVYLDARNVPIHQQVVSIGSLNANIVHPREVFKPALAHSAAAVILIHNHPSGDVSPSQEDLQLTTRLVEAGRLLGIEVLDHVIVAEQRFLSFRSESYL